MEKGELEKIKIPDLPSDAALAFLNKEKRDEIAEKHPGLSIREVHDRLGKELFEKKYGPIREFEGEQLSNYQREDVTDQINALSFLLDDNFDDEQNEISRYKRIGQAMSPAERQSRILELEKIIMETDEAQWDKARDFYRPILHELMGLSKARGDTDLE
jgi:hypothetical protein